VNGDQLLLTLVYTPLVLVCLAGAVWLIRTTRPARTGEVDHGRMAGLENRWGIIVIVLLVALLALTIFSVPYGKTDAPAGAQRVTVGAQQFGWAIRPSAVRVAEPVEFRLTSRDVQHGFGVYDGTKLLFQVQVPADGEPEQRYVHTFTKKGTYDILCLEFCGFQHHMMRGVLKVN
jgi:cytochrome c oxidase subunit II